MCQIIEFPQNQNDRIEKIKSLMEKKKHHMLHIKKQPNPPPQPLEKKQTIINAVTTLQLTGLTDLTHAIKESNDTLKYVTDCLYDVAHAIYTCRLVMFACAVIVILAVVSAVISTLVLGI